MMRYAVGYSERAEAEVQAQVHYIAIDKRSPVNAARWLRRLRLAVEKLELMPDRNGVDAEQSAVLGFEVRRMVFERTYLVFYVVDEAERRVTVTIFRHGGRAQ